MDHEFRAIPVLRIFDLPKALEFYVGFLGMAVDWEHRFGPGMPAFLQVSRGSLILNLSEHHGDATPGSAVRVLMTGLDAYHAEVTAKGYGHMRPGIESQEWGLREMAVIDPFGNRLIFSEPIAGRPVA